LFSLEKRSNLVGWLFLFSLFSFVSVFLRQDLFGDDSYAAWLCISHGQCDWLGFQPLAVFLYQVLPNNLFLFQVIMFGCFFASIIALFLVCEHFFDKKIAFYATLLLTALSPLMLFEFGKFENEIFAYPLLFFGFYFFLQKDWLKGFLFFVLASWFWAGSLYFVVALCFGYWFLIPFVFVSVFLFWDKGLSFLVPTLVLESRFLGGFLGLFGLIFVVPFFFCKRFKRFWFCFVLLLGLVAFQGKLVMLLMPFLVLSIGQLLVFIQQKQYDIKNVLVIVFIFIICWNIVFLQLQPTNNDWKIVNKAVEIQKDTNFVIHNDFGFGYWLLFANGNTKWYGGFPNPDYNNLQKPFIAVTQEELNCPKIDSYETWAKKANLFICK